MTEDAERKTWQRMTITDGTRRGRMVSFYRETSRENVKIWVDKDASGTYHVTESLHDGKLEFTNKVLANGFKSARAARAWADEHVA